MTTYTEISLRYAKQADGETLRGNDGTLIADLEGSRDLRIYDTEGRCITIDAEHFDGLLDALLEIQNHRQGRKAA